MNNVEFSKRQRITYYDGERFHPAVVDGLYINPLNTKVTYNLVYRVPNQKGINKVTVTPDKIRESEQFK